MSVSLMLSVTVSGHHPHRHSCVLTCCVLQEYVNLNNEDSYLMAAGAQALVSSKAGRAAKVRGGGMPTQRQHVVRFLMLCQRKPAAALALTHRGLCANNSGVAV